MIRVFVTLILLALLLVVGSVTLNDGVFSWHGLQSASTVAGDLAASDVSNGLYETRSGRQLFFVRGLVKNQGRTPSRVLVRAEMVERDTALRDVEAAAGIPPTVEELFLIGASDDLKRLYADVGKRAPVVQPGDEAPFLIAFYEYPQDLKSFRIRLSARVDLESEQVKKGD
jgi:hypothetical protein